MSLLFSSSFPFLYLRCINPGVLAEYKKSVVVQNYNGL